MPVMCSRGQTWTGGAPAASSVGRGSIGGCEQGALMLPLLPQGTAPVAHTQQHILKEGRPLQADDGSIVGPHTRLAVVWMLLSLCPHIAMANAHVICLHNEQTSSRHTGDHAHQSTPCLARIDSHGGHDPFQLVIRHVQGRASLPFQSSLS